MARNKEEVTAKATKSSQVFIPCRVAPGMFRNEWLIYVDVFNPNDPNQKVRAQLLVDQREVSEIRGTPQQSNPADGWLRVSLISYHGEWAEIVLPQPSQPLGENVLVEKKSVKKEPGT